MYSWFKMHLFLRVMKILSLINAKFSNRRGRAGALTHMARATINHKSGSTPLWRMFWGANKWLNVHAPM
jgi:hypothetical protein